MFLHEFSSLLCCVSCFHDCCVSCFHDCCVSCFHDCWVSCLQSKTYFGNDVCFSARYLGRLNYRESIASITQCFAMCTIRTKSIFRVYNSQEQHKPTALNHVKANDSHRFMNNTQNIQSFFFPLWRKSDFLNPKQLIH